MRFLLDTHVLLWFLEGSSRLSSKGRKLIEDPASEPVFSVATIWEVAIKQALKREGFDADARLLRRALLDNDFEELQVAGSHAIEVQGLPHLHRDPFDRMLIAQARAESMALFTADRRLLAYDSPVRLI